MSRPSAALKFTIPDATSPRSGASKILAKPNDIGVLLVISRS
jgi:hypothetical protein